VHDLSLAAQRVSAQARADASVERDCGGSFVRTARFRSLCSSLVVALWTAACETSYMQDNSADAFRPFCCGVYYATKRGLKLDDGTVLVPRCPQLAAALPALRGTGGNSLAKTLHSSSHRGLCTLSRAIASVPAGEQARVFAQPARVAREFEKAAFSSRDV
jgi:hypothetical protein